VLHEKLVESCSHIVSLKAELKSPIATSCSTCELHVVNNLELAHYVDRLQDENDELKKCLSWLSGQEPQLGIMIATFSAMMVKHLGLTKLERVVVREMRKLEKFLSHHIQHQRTSLSLSLTI
jgi:heterodisulfide reductase subunit B